eukprot:CAMPEP_0119263422 /NCGR_PEP_ID=MMETSP1329-20130426/2832_1 /TAXON_ID=114041 /ORGANISM="Genus nov. species nov., Strain RCC1024" /LENGTH=205 /DNA_ID=CAMNT_0007263123 /DNA_START=1 /DNA_END=620 /DNA_ORIENTATION=-
MRSIDDAFYRRCVLDARRQGAIASSQDARHYAGPAADARAHEGVLGCAGRARVARAGDAHAGREEEAGPPPLVAAEQDALDKKKKSADAEPLSPGSRRKKSLVNSAIKGMKNATGLRKKTDPALKKIAADISVDVPPDGPSFSVPSPLTVPPEAAVEAKDEVLAKLAPAEPAPESFLSALQQYFPKLNLTCCVQPAPGERVLASQ